MFYILSFVNSMGKETFMRFDDYLYGQDFVTCFRFYDCVDFLKRTSYVFDVDKLNYIERVIKENDKIIRERVEEF